MLMPFCSANLATMSRECCRTGVGISKRRMRYDLVNASYILGGCPFHGRVERDEIPTRESPPKQSGTRWTE